MEITREGKGLLLTTVLVSLAALNTGNNLIYLLLSLMISLMVADFLAGKGCSITIIEMLKRSPVLKFTSHGYMLHKRVREAGITMLFDTTVGAIEEDAVVTLCNGEEIRMQPVDQVILATGMESSAALKVTLAEEKIRHFVIGDARVPRRIIEATDEGARAAWEL